MADGLVNSADDTTNTRNADAELAPAPEEPSNAAETANVYEAEGLDASDMLIPSTSNSDAAPQTSATNVSEMTSTQADEEEKNNHFPREVSPSQLLRYRRRCAPVLLATSPRTSEIVMHEGTRHKIDLHRCRLKPFTVLPPMYQAHNFLDSASVSNDTSSPESAAEDTEDQTDANDNDNEVDANDEASIRPPVWREISNISVASSADSNESATASSSPVDVADRPAHHRFGSLGRRPSRSVPPHASTTTTTTSSNKDGVFVMIHSASASPIQQARRSSTPEVNEKSGNVVTELGRLGML